MELIEQILDQLIPSAYACVGCGQDQSFTPTILAVGMGFVILPVGLAAYIGWRLWQDHKQSKK